MKIVFSRKGFDSSAGGVPSPILPDGSMCSLPIPIVGSRIPYSAIQWEGRDLGIVVNDLTRGRIYPEDDAHLDPDLNPTALPRKAGWQPLFGQCNAAQKHLSGQGVGVGDLFLYFGWFKRVETRAGQFRYVRDAPDQHVLFGWLRVGDVFKVDSFPEDRRAWAEYHPHFRFDSERDNTLYAAAPELGLPTLQRHVPGAGVFRRYESALCLTHCAASNRSVWRLPRWFFPETGRPTLSFHDDLTRWEGDGPDHVRLQTVGRGQEFVLDCDHYPEAAEWLGKLFATAA